MDAATSVAPRSNRFDAYYAPPNPNRMSMTTPVRPRLSYNVHEALQPPFGDLKRAEPVGRFSIDHVQPRPLLVRRLFLRAHRVEDGHCPRQRLHERQRHRPLRLGTDALTPSLPP
eukprot:6202752-Pleurochrysis_carterae.AAC.1